MGTYKTIRVCHLVSGDLWAGAEVQMYTLIKALKEESDISLMAVVLNEGKLATCLKELGIHVVVIDETMFNTFQIIRKIKNELNGKVDILHTHRYKENIIGALIKSSCRIKYLIRTVHGISEKLSGVRRIKGKLYSFLDNTVSDRYIDLIIAVSNSVKVELSKSFNHNRLITVHNFIDPESINPIKTPEEIRKEFHISLDAPIIGSAGRLMPIKGYDIFLKMAAVVLKSFPKTIFMLAGDGPLMLELKELSQKIGVEKSVIFTGFRDDIIDIINTFDIFAMTSLNEGTPMVLLEAMSLKKAIVATSVGGIAEIIEDGKSGLLAQPGKVDEIAKLCCSVLNNKNLKKEIGSRARERLVNNYSSRIQASKMLNIYRKGAVGN